MFLHFSRAARSVFSARLLALLCSVGLASTDAAAPDEVPAADPRTDLATLKASHYELVARRTEAEYDVLHAATLESGEGT